jgi:SAM-dependent methyltransferase
LERPIQTNPLVLAAIIVLFIAGLWYFIPLLYGLPWIPAKRDRIYRALALADLKPNETLYDLGAGDGRVLTIAASEYGAIAIGIEISPVHCLIAIIRTLLKGVRSNITIRWQNLYRSDFSDADVVFVSLTQGHAVRIKSLLKEQLEPGARVVTLSSDLDGWEPTGMDSKGLIFLYKMPPIQGSIASFMAREAGLPVIGNRSPSGEIES